MVTGAIGCVSLLCGIFIFNLDFILLTCGQYYIFISLNLPPSRQLFSLSLCSAFVQSIYLSHLGLGEYLPVQAKSWWWSINVWLWCGWVGQCDFSVSPKSKSIFPFGLPLGLKSRCNKSYSQYICTLTRARRIIVCCWIFALFYSSPWLLLSTVKYSCIEGFGMVRYNITWFFSSLKSKNS